MNTRKIFLGMLLFAMPIILRILWFHSGFFIRGEKILSPEYETILIPQPALSTPVPYKMVPGREERVISFDQAHGNKFTITEIDSLIISLNQLGSEISILKPQDDLDDFLKKSDAFVIIAPSKDYQESEIEAVEEFVSRGGRVLIITDPTRSTTENEADREKSVVLANEVLRPFKLAFRNDYIYNLTHNEGNFRNIFIYPTADISVVEGINELIFYSAHSISSSTEKILVSDAETKSSLDVDGELLSISALDASGNVLAIGDLTFMTSPYNQVVDNNRFIMNIAKFISDGDRTKLLADFPFVFNTHIGVILTDGISLDGDLLDILAELKNKFSAMDIDISILEKPDEQYDLLILGQYPPKEDLAKWVAPFGINFSGSGINQDQDMENEIDSTSEIQSDNSKVHLVPGFGVIPADEVGFLLLDQMNSQQRLFLLSDNQESIYSLLDRMIIGTLDQCLANERIAVCPQESLPDHPERGSTPTEMTPDSLPNDATVSPEPSPTATVTPLP